MSTAPTPQPSAVRNRHWMNVAEVCEALDVCERAIWTWEKAGVIPKAVRRGKRWTRWKRSHIEEFVRTGQLPEEPKR